MTGNDPKAGLGGWLIMVAIGLVFSPLRLLALIYAEFWPLLSDGTWAAISTETSPAFNAPLRNLLTGEVIFNSFMFAACLSLVFLFFGRNRHFPRLYIGVSLAAVIFIPVDAWVAASFFPSEPIFDPDTQKEFLRSCVAAIVWIPYMLISKRVRLTFVERSRNVERLAVSLMIAIPVLAIASVQGVLTSQRGSFIGGEVTEEDRVITANDGVLRLRIPKHWDTGRVLREEAILQAANEFREEYMFVLTIPKEDFDGSLEVFSDSVLQELMNGLTDAAQESSDEYAVDVFKVRQHSISGNIDGIGLLYHQSVFESEASYYRIVSWTLLSQREVAFPVFDSVTRSISLTPKEAQISTPELDPAEASWKVAWSDEGSLMVQIPSTWSGLSDLNEAAVFQAGSISDSEYMIVISDPKADFIGNLSDYAEATSGFIGYSLANPVIEKPREFSIGENRAIEYSMTGSADHKVLCYLHASVEGAEFFYQLIFWTVPSRREQAFAVFQEITDRISFPDTGIQP